MSETTGILNAIEISPSKFGGDQVRINVSGTWYDYGKFAPRGMTDGDTVKVKFTTNDRGYHKVERGGLFKVDPGSAPASPQQGSNPAPKPTYVDNRQDTISKQAAVNTAISMVDLQIKHGGIKLPTKPADIYTVVQDAVLEEALRLFKQNTGSTWKIEEDKVAVGSASRTASADDNGTDDYPN